MLASHTELIENEVVDALTLSSGIPRQNLIRGIQLQFTGFANTPLSEFPWRRFDGELYVAIVSAGNIPGVAVAPALLLAAIGCPVIVKLSHADQILFPWLLEKFEKRYEPSGISCGYWHWESKEFSDLLRGADKVIAFGSDLTTQSLQKQFGTKLLAFGHKFSIGIVDLFELDAFDFAGTTLDVSLFLQEGCLSPQTYFVRGTMDEVLKCAELFFEVLQNTFRALGGNNLEAASVFRRHALIDELDMLGEFYFADSSRSCIVTISENLILSRLLGAFVVQFVPFSSLDDLAKKLTPIAKWLQGASLQCEPSRHPIYESLLMKFGCTYITTPGSMQSPPITWNNGGFNLLEKILE